MYNVWRETYLIRDTPNWSIKYPTGPVHFDIKCPLHGTEYLDLTPEQLPSEPLQFRDTFKCCYAPIINE